MQHIAIDLGGRRSQVCVRREDGSIVQEKSVQTRNLRAFLAKEPPSRVIVESCSEAFAAADAALETGHEARVVPATLAPTLGVGSRRTKNDVRDSRILSEVSCRIELPSVHISSKESRSRKAMVTARDAIVRARTLLINSVRGYARTVLGHVAVQTGTPPTFPSRVRKALSIVPSYIEQQLTVIETMTKEIVAMNKELVASAKADPVCRRLMTVPGVGALTATIFVAVIDDVGRFSAANRLQSYVGLTPGEHRSSGKGQALGITKAGSPSLRRALVQAAWAARRASGEHPMLRWAAEIEKRRGKNIAVIALARKMAGILFALWRDGSEYKPTLAAST